MYNKQQQGDRIIAFAVMIQSLLIVLQSVMIGYFKMEEEATTTYRVALTAIPMVAAMVVAIVRKPVRFFTGYFIVMALLLFTMGLFPDNAVFVVSQGFKFLLPVVIPSFLCLTVVNDYRVVENTLYVVSWFTVLLVLFYVFGFFTGVITLANYNMALSFACVLPFVSLYSHRRLYDLIVCLILFVVVLANGARGPALCIIIYVIIDMFQNKRKGKLLIIVVLLLFVVNLSVLNTWLGSIGVSSRTLRLLYEGEIAGDSGRASIREYFIKRLLEQPVLGIGLFGDRVWAGAAYCHNIFLEIILDFGIPLGGGIIVLGLVKLVSLYLKSDSENRNRIIGYFCSLVLPFMTSGSYLIDSRIAIFLGICYLVNKQNRINPNVDIIER